MSVQAQVWALGGVWLELHAALDLQQSYETLGGWNDRRTLNGTGIRRWHWQRLRTTISGAGWTPPGLAGLDYSVPMALLCPVPRGINAAGTTIPLPAGRRTDTGHTPLGWALAGTGVWVPTSVAIAADVATLGAVGGATLYRVLYWPLLQVYAQPPQEQVDRATGSYRWALTAEEV